MDVEGDTVTVDCVNSDRCGGRITLRHAGDYLVEASPRSDATMYLTEKVRQTCDCEYSDDERDEISERAEVEFNRMQWERSRQG